MSKVTAYFQAADGRRIHYTPDPRFIPNGSLSVPVAVWRQVLPGAGRFSPGQPKVTEVKPGVFRYEGRATFARHEQGADGVWREVPGSEETFSWVVVTDHRDPLRRECETCEGYGALRLPSCNHAGCACPCGSMDCPECEGKGSVPAGCDWCGEDATRQVGRQVFCDDCNQPREDGPLGGMGFGISYTDEQEKARRLK